jgi:hypothetical protein
MLDAYLQGWSGLVPGLVTNYFRGDASWIDLSMYRGYTGFLTVYANQRLGL